MVERKRGRKEGGKEGKKENEFGVLIEGIEGRCDWSIVNKGTNYICRVFRIIVKRLDFILVIVVYFWKVLSSCRGFCFKIRFGDMVRILVKYDSFFLFFF